jgi:uncharacterized protein YPO0396
MMSLMPNNEHSSPVSNPDELDEFKQQEIINETIKLIPDEFYNNDFDAAVWILEAIDSTDEPVINVFRRQYQKYLDALSSNLTKLIIESSHQFSNLNLILLI